ncbi:response regulator receiver domain protein (CheY-like receiver) [Novosphingobium sp. Rr 2-17]|nr:response regulator receiver domain protein (CheY-like receiver) [Novosphingobium sp. Rr 2-17]
MTEPEAPLLLYVEDEILIQDMLVSALEEAGFRLLVADDGTQALKLLAEEHGHLHGIITDINLGDGPEGWDVARTARELINSLPIVYVSGASEHEWYSKGVPNSIMVAKPFVPAQVVVAISSLLTVAG